MKPPKFRCEMFIVIRNGREAHRGQDFIQASLAARDVGGELIAAHDMTDAVKAPQTTADQPRMKTPKRRARQLAPSK